MLRVKQKQNISFAKVFNHENPSHPEKFMPDCPSANNLIQIPQTCTDKPNIRKQYLNPNLFKLLFPIMITVGSSFMVAQHVQSRRHRIKARKPNLKESER